ncbi:large conductance mechanosensitive channel protein MscL [Hymenobacter glacialis]|uniref:Large-conductance mechanosensitive channel n=1 Tax=Hymenobacter glacialis TaxID=1908236 RepID=A0A1G1TBT4_9BACT|nr:large conductance mechanosensitive channel protein MscL [Hymenobacter glacialis]OGX88330.1 large-conductance mechanosensitive channel protein [Hymenobacter glacialis]
MLFSSPYCDTSTGFVSKFKEFISKGDVLDPAVGVTIGAAFGKIATSLTHDIPIPVLSLFTGGIDLQNMFVALDGKSYTTLEEAKKAGSAALAYGNFINEVICFLIIASVIFWVVKAANSVKKKPLEVSAVPAAPTAEQQLLMEIRDSLRTHRG